MNRLMHVAGLIAATLFAPSTQAIVAYSQGQADVGSGQFNYTVDIKSPSGVAGLAPALSISYNSGNDNNGLLGVGFSLNGLSAITVCNENTFAEKVSAARDYNYCLDGQKLLPIDPAQTYGAANTVYRTEINSQAKIIKKSWGFEVRSKDGLIHDYGLNADAKRNNLSFSISRIRDRNNNQIHFSYGGGSEAQYITQISYAGNTIDFSYEARQDTGKNFYRGLISRADVRLKQVTTKINGLEQSKYVLNYGQNARGESIVQNVQECAPTVCLDPIYFSWEEASNANGTFAIHSAFPNGGYGVSANEYKYLNGDFNGDGKTDLVHLVNDSYLHVWLSNGDGTFMITTPFPNNGYGLGSNNYNFKVGDFDGDGRSDLIHFANNSYVHVWFSNGDGTFFIDQQFPNNGYAVELNNYHYILGDYNGDGRTDLFHVAAWNYGQVWLSNGDGTFDIKAHFPNNGYDMAANNYTFSAGDFNGDGKTDLIHFVNHDYLHVWLSNGDGTFAIKGQFPNTGYGVNANNYNYRLGDFNGDGLTDLVHLVGPSYLHVWLSNGDGTFTIELPFNTYNISANNFNFRVGDYDGDGDSDLLNMPNNDYIHVWHSNGDGTFDIKAAFPNSPYAVNSNNFNFIDGDFNGDGASDMFHLVGPTYGHVWETIPASPQRVFNVDNLHGHTVTIEYSTLSDPSVYVAGGSVTYPQLDIDHGTTALVKSITTPDGIGGSDTTTFKYHDLRYHFENGSQGFAKVEEFNALAKSQSVTEYHQAFPYTGLVKSSRMYINGALIGETINTFNVGYYYGSSGIANIQKTQSIKRDYTETLLSELIDDFSLFDQYGNVGQVNSTVNDLSGELKRTVTTNTYSNVESNWLLSRLTNAEVTHISAAGQLTRRSEFTYKANGLLLTEVIEPNTSYWKKKHYTYDSFGNIVSIYTTAASTASRTMSSTYSADGKYLLSKTNPLGHVQSYSYDANGRVATTTDFNGNVTSYGYDAIGRQVSVTEPDGITTVTTRSWDNSVPNAIYKQTITRGSESPAVAYFDLLERKIRTIAVGFDGRLVLKDQLFDAKGQAYQSSNLYFAGDIPSWIVSTFDDYGRQTQVTAPAPDGTQATTIYSYYGLTATVTNPKGYSKTTTKNGLGQVVSVAEGATLLQYEYTADGKLKATIDTLGNEIVLTYDIRGNRTSMSDPNIGTWYYSYNALDELTQQIDAKNQAISFEYDKLGRVIKKTSPDGIYTWVYDTQFKGMVSSETGPGISTAFNYDSLGKVLSKTTTTDGKTFTESFSYDSLGRILTKTLAGGLQLEYRYNATGHLERIVSPLGAINNFDSLTYTEQVTDSLKQQAQAESAQQQTLIKALRYEQQADELLSQGLITLAEANTLRSTAALLHNQAKQYGEEAARHQASSDMLINHMSRYDFALNSYDYLVLAQGYRQLTQSKLAVAKGYINEPVLAERLAQTGEVMDQAHDSLNTSKRLIAMGDDEGAQSLTATPGYHTFYQVDTMDAFGRVTQYQTGDGLITYNNFGESGALNETKTETSYGFQYRFIEYDFDVLGNVTHKHDRWFRYRHWFYYDEYNRLTNDDRTIVADVNEVQNMTYQYDLLGNITYRSDVGNYSYSTTKPNQLLSAGSRTYQYDTNGNMTNNNGKLISYNSDNKPTSIQTNGNTVTFAYDMNLNRYKKTTNDHTTYYIGKSYEQIEYNTGVVEKKHFVYANNTAIAIHKEIVDSGNSSYQTNYMYYDLLGSVDSVTDYLGVVRERNVYDAYGKVDRRDRWGEVPSTANFTNRGFTGHEHIDDSDLIHMNGRVYDASIGRFISADPTIDGEYSHHGYNRYAYVSNNPQRYTDPSGYGLFSFFGSIFRGIAKVVTSVVSTVVKTVVNNIKPIIAIAAAVASGGLVSAAVGGLGGAILGGAAAGFSSGAILTGTLNGALSGALWGGIGGGVAFGIGSYAASLTQVSKLGRTLIKSGLHGLSRGGINALRGNSFASGFASGAISAASNSIAAGVGQSNYALGAAVGAASGGLSSAIAGDKFENGAVSGAFVYMFNDAMHKEQLRWERIKMAQRIARHLMMDPTFNGSGADGLSEYTSINAEFDLLVAKYQFTVQQRLYRNQKDMGTAHMGCILFLCSGKASGEIATWAIGGDISLKKFLVAAAGMTAIKSAGLGTPLIAVAQQIAPDAKLVGGVSIDFGYSSRLQSYWFRVNVEVGASASAGGGVGGGGVYGRAWQVSTRDNIPLFWGGDH